jgi:Mor family transcriptional regulator
VRSKHSPIKLTDDAVRAIRAEYKIVSDSKAGGLKAANIIELAKRYRVSQDTIRQVAKRRSYQWVK